VRSLDTDVAHEARHLVAPNDSPDEALAGRQVERALEQSIAALEPMYREVLLLRDVEGLSAAEVAEVVGASVQAVKSRLHRARLSVRERVAPLLGLEAPPPAPEACPDVLMMFSRHLEDEISADSCAEMQRHLEGCARCRGTCDSLKRTLALCRTAGPSVPIPSSVRDAVKAAVRSFLAENA
jgi:RNA polymerase sigma-70 factor (ECF subfamily)